VTFAREAARRAAEHEPGADLVGLIAMVAVPLLAAGFPRWAAQWAMPLLAVTSMGIFVTIADTERVSVAMVLVVAGTVLCLASGFNPPRAALACVALAVIGAAVLDSDGRTAPIVRAVGCFGVLLAAPIADALNNLRTLHGGRRRPPVAVLGGVHCVVVAWSSRLLVRETSAVPVVLACGGALLLAVVILFAIAPRGEVEP
jgi:hypothetical protein